eukprot:UN07320
MVHETNKEQTKKMNKQKVAKETRSCFVQPCI